MSKSKKEILSAQVIVYSASRKPIDGRTVINAQNVHTYSPDQNEVLWLVNLFKEKEFDVGEFAGISFSITASIDTFKKFFNVELRKSKDRGLEFYSGGVNLGRELKDEHLPKTLKKYVQALVLPNPPDFGPTDW